jgi:hypothetical protein
VLPAVAETPVVGDPKQERRARPAAIAFAAIAAGSFVFYLWAGRHLWFTGDEWDFILDRDGADVRDLLRPHNEHFSAIPILVYRGLWQTFGINAYLPYRVIVLCLHVTVAFLLRAIMRRAGVRPWFATGLAAVFLLVAARGWQDIMWPFQIGFVGSLACGLAHVLLADHDGGIDRRDVAGLGLGVIGLASSGVAVTMVAAVGMSTLLRRGWRVAAFHTLPFGALFLGWWFGVARDEVHIRSGSRSSAFAFVARGIDRAFETVVRLPAGGALLGISLVVGLWLAWRPLPPRERRRIGAAPLGLMLGAPVFLAIAASGRAGILGSDYARSPRYTHIVLALLAPATALAIDSLARRWRAIGPAFAVVVVVAVARNVLELDAVLPENRRVRGQILALAQSPPLGAVPRDVEPYTVPPRFVVTVGWLQDGTARGKIPRSDSVGPRLAAQARFGLSVEQSDPRRPLRQCRPFVARTQHLRAGEHVDFDGALIVRLNEGPGEQSMATGFASKDGDRLEIHSPVTLDLAPFPETEAHECS